MTDLLSSLFSTLAPLWKMSLTAVYVAAVVFLLRLLLKGRVPRQVLCLLWLVVFVRLALPMPLQSPDTDHAARLRTEPGAVRHSTARTKPLGRLRHPAPDAVPGPEPSPGRPLPL